MEYHTDSYGDYTDCFISRNGTDGFSGYFDTLFSAEEFEKILIIQGGPGTGKSAVMKKLWRMGQEKGLRAECIRCSSDPTSLDGVILHHGEKKIGILDGTYPHARIPNIPGAKEEILNFGDYWNKNLLQGAKEEILLLNLKKKQTFRQLYDILASVGSVHMNAMHVTERFFMKEKASEAIGRLLHQFHQKGRQSRRLIRAFSMQGEVTLHSMEKQAEHITVIDGDEFSAELYLSILAKTAIEKELECVILESPLQKDLLDGIYFPETKTLYLKQELIHDTTRIDKIIRMSRYKDVEIARIHRASLRTLKKAEDMLLQEALHTLSRAGYYHMALEKIYTASMNFPLLQAATDVALKQLLVFLVGEG